MTCFAAGRGITKDWLFQRKEKTYRCISTSVGYPSGSTPLFLFWDYFSALFLVSAVGSMFSNWPLSAGLIRFHLMHRGSRIWLLASSPEQRECGYCAAVVTVLWFRLIRNRIDSFCPMSKLFSSGRLYGELSVRCDFMCQRSVKYHIPSPQREVKSQILAFYVSGAAFWLMEVLSQVQLFSVVSSHS